MTTKRFAVLALLAAVCAPTGAGAQESTGREHHGYGGGGLMLTSNTLDSGGSQVDSGGAGIFASGAGLFDVSNVVGIGVNGGFFGGERTYDDTDVDASEGQFAVDGGAVLFDILYLTLGVQSYAYTIEDPFLGDITFSYVVVPLGVGVFKATDSGYLLAQLRFGGGTASEDYNDSEEDLGYFGIRLMGQIGAANGVQFLGGMELDSYDFKDSDGTDDYFRIFLGVAFGT